MIDESINSIINNLCNKFGTTVDNIIPEVARYQAVSCGIDFITGIILLTIAILLVRYMLKNKIDPLDDNNILGVTIFLTTVSLTVFGFAKLSDGLNMFTWIFAPKGAFVNYVYEMLK